MSNFKNGSVKVSNSTITKLIAEAALTVDEVKKVIGYKNNKIDNNKKEGIVVVIDKNDISIALHIVLSENKNIFDIAENVQKAIKENISVMLGFNVKEVDVFVISK